MGKSKHKLLIILMVAVLAVTACGLLLSACAEEPVTVILDANGGTFTGGGTTLQVPNLQPGDTLDLSSYAPTRDGYTLSQWTDSNRANVRPGMTYIVPTTALPGSTITLAAQWTENEVDDNSISALRALENILGAMTNGDNLHSEYSTRLTVPDGSGGTTIYSIQYASNVKRGIANQGEYDYDLGLVIRNETINEGVIGLYVTDAYGIPGGLYVDTDPDSDDSGSVYLLEDFNADYLLALVEKLPDTLLDLNISGINVMELLLVTALGATGSATTDASGNDVYTIAFNPTALNNIGPLVSALLGSLISGIDLDPLFAYLEDIIPDSLFTLSGTVDSRGNLTDLSSSFVNNETGETLYDISGGSITVTDRNEDTLSLIPSKVEHYNNTYSFGHIQLSAAASLNTASGMNGQVDIASIINTFVPGVLPEGILMLNADLEYRLDVAIDLDIAQKPYSEEESAENIQDESVIAIEIKDIQNNDNVIAGVYYRNGYIYVNIGQIVNGLTGSAEVWQGKGFAIPFDLPSLITAIKEAAVTAIDGFFGTDHGMITGGTDLTKLEDAVVSLALAQDGNIYISQDWANLISTVFAVLEIEGDWVNITSGPDYDTLNITINKTLIDEVLQAIGGFGVDVSAIQIPDFGEGRISISSGSSGIKDLTIGLNMGGVDLEIVLDKFELLKPIEKDDTKFDDYVDGVIGDTEYTSSLNDLIMSTLSSGVQGSIGLDISFNQGIYNLGDLIAIFGLDLGDLTISVLNDVNLSLSLNAGLYIDETNYEKSALYLELVANDDFSLQESGAIIEAGKVLGLYLKDNDIILDVSALEILGVSLPVYKISGKDFDVASLVATLLANIPEMNLAIDLTGVIDSLTPPPAEGEEGAQEAATALAGSGNILRSAARVSNNDLINIVANNNVLSATTTLTAIISLLSSLGLNVDFDASQFLQGEAVISVQLTDGELSVTVSGDLLLPEDGGTSGLEANLSLDLANDWRIGGNELKANIDRVIAAGLPSGWQDADDALLDGLFDVLFNSTVELSLTLPGDQVGISGLLIEILSLIPGLELGSADSEDGETSILELLQSLDLGIVSEKAEISLKVELYKQGDEQLIKLGITYADAVIAEILLNNEDSLYLNLDYFGLGKYVLKDSGIYALLTGLLDQLSVDLSLGSLLGGLVDFSGNLNFKAYNTSDAEGNPNITLRWNKYGAASSVYYKVYSGSDNTGTLLFDTGAADATGFTFDEATGIYTAQTAVADSYFIEVYTVLKAEEGAAVGKNQSMFNALAAPETYAPMVPTAVYENINAVTFTWQVKEPFSSAAETYALYDAAGALVLDLANATYDASTFTYTYAGVDLTGKTGPYSIYVNGEATEGFGGITPEEGAVTQTNITISLSEATNTARWASLEGASYYIVSFTDASGELWNSRVADSGRAYSSVMWGDSYSNYTVTVTAYDENDVALGMGSASSSAGGGVMDTVTTLLSALSIKGNIITLNVTREILSELISALVGGDATISLIDLNVTELDIFNGSLSLTLGIYEDASVEDGDGYKISGNLTLSNTVAKPAVAGEEEEGEYTPLSLLYGAGVVKSITSILSEGISVEAQLNIDLQPGAYNVSEIVGSLLPDEIASYLGDSLTWTVGSGSVPPVIEMNLGVYAYLAQNPDESSFMVQLSFPEGVSLSGTGDGDVVAGNGFIIKKGAAVTIAVSGKTLVVDLSAITILGITLPVYKVENFNMGAFVEGYLVQLERVVANLYNDNNGMLYLPDSSSVTADADSVDFTIAFDYIGNDMTFETVYATEGTERAITANHTYDAATTTHTISGSYAATAKAGDYIAVYALDKLGNRYDCLKLTASQTDGGIQFAVSAPAQTAALADGVLFENYISIDKSKLELVIASQTIFSLLSQVVDINANIQAIEFTATIGVGERNPASGEKSIWADIVGTLDNKSVAIDLNAGIGIGGRVEGQNIPDYISDKYAALPVADENEYPSKLIAGILDEVLTSTITLSLTADAAQEQGFDLLSLAKQFVGGVVNLGDTALDLVAQADGDPVSIDLVLALDGKMDGANVNMDMISLQLNYRTRTANTTLIGIYVYRNALWLDLSGIGMGAVKVDAGDVIGNLTSYLGGLIDGIDIDLAGILDMIAAGGTYPYGEALTQSLADANAAPAADTATIVNAIISLVSIEHANIKLNISNAIINELLSLVDTLSMSLNAEASGYIDIFAGKAEIDATIKDSSSKDASELALKLELGFTSTSAVNINNLKDRIDSLTTVDISLDDMNNPVVNLLNSLSAKLNLNITAEGGTTDIWTLVGPILDQVLNLKNQNAIDAIEAIKSQGIDWTIEATNIDLDLILASDLTQNADGSINTQTSTLVVGIVANTPLVLGTAGENNIPILAEGDGIYLTIYGGSLYIDLSQLKLLDITFPVLKVGTFEVMDYINEVAGTISNGINGLLEGLPQTQQAVALAALAAGDNNPSLVLGNDLTLSVALSAILQILKDTSIINLTALNLPWELVLTTATGGDGQLQLRLDNIADEDYQTAGLEAALTLSAQFKERVEGDETDVRNTLITYVNGTGEEGNVAERFESASGDLIAEVIDSVLTSRLTLELGGDSDKDVFDIKYALNGILGLLGMDDGIESSLAFNIDTSKDMKYRLNLILDGSAADLSATKAYLGIEMASGAEITEESWESVIGIYIADGDIYIDVSAIKNGALGGGVLKVTGSAIMDLFETELNKLLAGINLDLNELLTLEYTPAAERVNNAPGLTVNSLPVGKLVETLIQMVSLRNLSVALDAHTGILQGLTEDLFGTAIDFAQADGNLLLVDGKLELNVRIGEAAFTEGQEPEFNVYKLGAVLDISRGTDISEKIKLVKEKPATDINLASGATLADSIMDVLGNVSLDLNLDISLPGGVFGIGDLLNSFGLVAGGLTDANGLDLIFEPLYQDADVGGMQLGLTLSLRLALDAANPENTLAMIDIAFNKDMVMGMENGEDKVLFKAGKSFVTLIIDGKDIYADMSDITLLGMTLPMYHGTKFDISTFVDDLLGRALDNVESVIFGGEEPAAAEGGNGDIAEANFAESDASGWTGLSANEALFIGVTENDIVAIVSFTAVEEFLELFGLVADLSNYDATIDLTITRDPEDANWMQLHFVGALDEDMYYEGAVTEGTISLSAIELGGTPSWTREVSERAKKIADGAKDAGNMLIAGIIDKVLNLSANLSVQLEEGSDTYISLASILGYIFSQTGIDVDLSEILLNLEGLTVGIDINLDIDPDGAHENSAATIEITDNSSTLIGIYLRGYDLILDLQGISLGRFAVTQSGIPSLIYDIVDDLLAKIKEKDIDLDTLVDKLYDLVEQEFKNSDSNSQQGNSATEVPEMDVLGALSNYGFSGTVTATDNGDGTTTFSWQRYSGASHYAIQLYNGYDDAKQNRITDMIVDGTLPLDARIDGDELFLGYATTSVTVHTEQLNNIGWLSDATSKYNGAEFPSYYVFVVRAGRYTPAAQEGGNGTFVPTMLEGQEVYTSTSNYTLLKTILGMVKIRNGAIEVDARAVMVDKLLRGVLGVSFDWVNANVNVDIVDGAAAIGINISDGDPEEYLATEATALPDDYNADADTLTYTWNLTAEQAENLAYVNFYLREREGDTSTYGNVLELPSNMASELYEWTMPTADNPYTLSLTINSVSDSWLAEVHRANADGDTTTNLAKALEGELPLRVTGYYDVNTVKLVGGLQLGDKGAEGASEALYEGADPLYVKNNETGAYERNANIQDISLYNNDSLLASVKDLLDGFRLSAELAIYVEEGRYDVMALISDILDAVGVSVEGLDEISSLYWNITSPFVFNLSLSLLLEYGASEEDMRIALVLESDGLTIDGNNAINPGTLIGLYYKNGKALLDLTNFKIAGITLPAYTIEIDLYTTLNDMLDDLLGGINISAVSGEGAAQEDESVIESVAEGANLARTIDEISVADAIVLGISSEEISLTAAFSAVASLLGSVLSGNETVALVSDVLKLLDLSLGLTMKKDTDLTLTLSGVLNWESENGTDEFVEKTVEATGVRYSSSTTTNGVTTLAYTFNTIAAASEYTATLALESGEQIAGSIVNGVAYFTDASLSGTTAEEGRYDVTVTGKITAPVNMELSLGTAQLLGGDKNAVKEELDELLGYEAEGGVVNGSVDFDAKVAEYGDKLLTGLIDSLLNTRITLELDLAMLAAENETLQGGTISLSDLVLAIAGDIAVSAGLTLNDILGAVDVNFNIDVTKIILDIAMNVSLDDPTQTDLMVQLKSDIGGVQDVLLGLYVYDSYLTIDLRALGLRAYTLQNFDYVITLQNMLSEVLYGTGEDGDTGLLGQYDINLSETIDGLLNPAQPDEGETVTPGTGEQPGLEAPAPDAPASLPTFSVTAKNKVGEDKKTTTTLSWNAVDGAAHYALIFTDANGNELSKATYIEYAYYEVEWSTTAWASGLYSVKVEAHAGNHELLATGSRQVNGAISSILTAVSLNNTIVGLEVTPRIINNLLAALAPSVSINTDPIKLGATVDIFNGDATAAIDLTLTYEEPDLTDVFRLGAKLSIKTADELYETGTQNPNGLINQALAELGSDVDTIDFGNPSDDAGIDASRITTALIDALNTTKITAQVDVSFSAGTYDIGAMIADMGIEALDGVSLLWTFNENQDIKLTLELGMNVNMQGSQGANGTMFLFDLRAENDIKLGEMIVNNNTSNGPYTITAGTSIISIYGMEEPTASTGTVYVDLSGISLLGLQLPVIKASYPFTNMLMNEFYDIIATIMDLGQYLEVSHSVDEGMTSMTFDWDDISLGASYPTAYDVTIVGSTPTGYTQTLYSEAKQAASQAVLGYDDLAAYSSFNVTVAAYSTVGGSYRLLAEHTTAIELATNEIATMSYITPDDVYAEEGNIELARVNNVKWNWTDADAGSAQITDAGSAQITWDPYEGAVAYRVTIRRASDGESLENSGAGDVALYASATSYTLNAVFFGALTEFESSITKGTPHPMVGAQGEGIYDYGYIAEVYAYTDEALAEELKDQNTQLSTKLLDEYSPSAVGAVNSFTEMSMWFLPGANYNFYVGWDKVAGATQYSVLPYRVQSTISGGVETITYPTVGAMPSGTRYTATNLVVEGTNFTYFNNSYTREYYVEVVAYDGNGNMVARGQMTAAMGKLNKQDSTLVPVSAIELVLNSERFGLEVQLDAVLAILEGVGVELPIDLRGFDVEAALGVDSTLETNSGASPHISAAAGDVDGFMLNGLNNGDHTLTMTYTNSGGVSTEKTLKFNYDGGDYTVTEGDYSIIGGYVNYGMRRNGTYVIALTGATSGSTTFVTSRTIALGITGNLMLPTKVPSGAAGEAYSLKVVNDSTSEIGVTQNGRTLTWKPVAGADAYTVHIEMEVDGKIVAEETFENLTSFIQPVDFTKAGVYRVSVTANDTSATVQTATVTVKGDSALSLTISIPYDGLEIGSGEDSTLTNLQTSINSKIEASNAASNNYDTVINILKAYLGTFKLSLDLNIDSFTSQFNLQTIINSILSAVGVSTEIGAPIYINTDDIHGMGVALNVEWSIDWETPTNSFASIELVYNNTVSSSGSPVSKTMLGVYLANGSVYADLTGVGLFGIQLSANSLYKFLTETIVSTIEGLFDGLDTGDMDLGEGINFSSAITSLLGEYPVINFVNVSGSQSASGVQTMALASGDTAAAESETQSASTDLTSIITSLLNAVSLESTNLFVKANTALLDEITSSLLGIKMGIDMELELQIPLLKGNIIADLRLDNVTFEAVLTIEAMAKDLTAFDGDMDVFLNANSTGAEFAMALLQSLPLNLTLELANSNMDTAAYKGYSPDTNWMGHASYPAGTRINVEVRTSAKTYGSDYQLQNAFTADAGDIVVTIATTNEAEQDSTGTGHLQYFLVVHIDISAGQISVKLCKRAIVLQAWAALGIIGEIDLGGGVSVFGSININIAAIPLNINIALDLASTLGNLLDGLLTTINGLGGASSDSGSTGSAGSAGGGNTSSGTGVTVDPYELAWSAQGGDESDQVVEGAPYEVHFNSIMNEAEWNGADGAASKWQEAYDRYIITVSRADGSIVDRKVVEVGERPIVDSSTPTRRTAIMNTNYYSSFSITITGETDPTGFAKAIEDADIDIWKLLGGGLVRGSYDTSGNFTPSNSGDTITTTGGINLNLNSSGEMNITIEFDPYEINKAVDAIFGSIFGANSALDLTTASLGNGYFAINYLMFMWWDRANMSENRLKGDGTGNNEHSFVTNEQNHPTSTLDSLAANLRGLLADLLYQMNIAVNTAGAVVSAADLRAHKDSLQWSKWDDSDWGLMPIILSVFSKFVPISIWTSAELNVNMSNGVLTNISFIGNDDGSAVLRYNKVTGVNDVYVYYAKTLYNGNGGDYNWYMPGSGADTDYEYNPSSQDIGRQINEETLKVPYRKTNTGGIDYQTMPVFTYAIPYGSVYGGDYDYTKVGVTPGTGANGGNAGYGGALASNGSSLYRRGGYDVNGSPMSGASGNAATTVTDRNKSNAGTLNSYTRIEIYNTSDSVNASTAGTGTYNQGVISWGNIPNYIVFDQYSMGWANNGEPYKAYNAGKYLWNNYFGNSYTARWQKGTEFSRASVTFRQGNSADAALVSPEWLNNTLSNSVSPGGTLTVYAVAKFPGTAGTQSMPITIYKSQIADNSTVENDEIVSVDSWNLYYYDALPEYVIVTTKSGQRKRYKVTTSGTQAARSGDYDALLTGIKPVGNNYSQSGSKTATLTFRNDMTASLTINYMDSTLVNPTVEVNMNQLYDEYLADGTQQTAADKIVNTIQGLMVYYADGAVLTNASNISWGGEDSLTLDTGITGSRFKTAQGGQVSTLNEWLTAFNAAGDDALKGDTFYIEIEVNPTSQLNASGDFTQTLTVIVDIPSKDPQAIIVRGAAENTVEINPYDYYMYLVTGDDSYNPLPASVQAVYPGGTESINVMWRRVTDGVAGNITSAHNYVNNWYVTPKTVKIQVENDETRYSFTWKRTLTANVYSGAIRSMQFLVNGDWSSTVPEGMVTTTARVTFTNGYVLEMPTVIRTSADGYGYAYIGYDVEKYNLTGALVEYEGCSLKQSKRIQIVKATNQEA